MWQSRLQDVYANFDEFEAFAETYGLHQRLGYETPRDAWDANPLVQGSVNPADYRRVSETKKRRRVSSGG